MNLYYEFYDKVDSLFKKYNPCQIDLKTGLCSGITNNHFTSYEWKRAYILCCAIDYKTICQYHDKERGCLIRSLGCKLFICDKVLKLEENNEFRIKLCNLKDEIHQLGIPVRCYSEL